MDKIIKTLALAFVAFSSAFAAPKIWDGTADVSWYEANAQAYNITTAEQLAGLAKLVNEGKSNFKGKTITIGANIFLNDTTGWGDGSWFSKQHNKWTSISGEFYGEIDGLHGKKNWTIYGLYADGLFGAVENADLKNIDLLVGDVGATGALADKAGNVKNVHSNVRGGLVGIAKTITNCSVETDSINLGVGEMRGGIAGEVNLITNSYFKGRVIDGNGSAMGGLVGKAGVIKNSYAEVDSIIYTFWGGEPPIKGGLAGLADTVSNSYFKGKIIRDCAYKGCGQFGGLVGKAGFVENSYAEVDHIVGGDYTGGIAGYAGNISEVHFKGNLVEGLSYVGGLVGKLADSISVSNSHAETNVKSNASKGDGYIGGLFGWAEKAATRNSYFIGTVIASESSINYVGGLVGSGNAVSHSYAKGDVRGHNYVGGLVGNAVAIDSSYHADGEVNGDSCVGGLAGKTSDIDSSYHTNGDVNGKFYVGGLVGKASTIESSYHTKGDVYGIKAYVGGLVGYSSIVKNSYAEGNVTSDSGYKEMYFSGISSYVGGLAGFAEMVDSSSHTNGVVKGLGKYVGGLVGFSSVVSNSYAKNDVSGYGSFTGGLAGRVEKNVIECFAEGTVENDGLGNGEGEFIGGLVGYVGTIDSVLHMGSIYSSFHTSGSVSGFEAVGCLAGGASVYDSYAECERVVGTNKKSNGSYTTATSYDVGGLVGFGAKIVNSRVKIMNVYGQNLVGGIAGYISDSVKNAYAEIDSVVGIFEVGGLIGRLDTNSFVDSSYATGNVKGDDNVGGLVGSAYGDISNSYAWGNIVGDEDNSSAGNDNLGGLVGYQYQGSISKSAAYGNIDGTTKLGGLVGRFDGTEIKQSHANGNVTGHYYGDPADEVGNYYIGGLVGYAKGKIDEIYVSSVVKGIEEEPVYTGCIVGYVNGTLDITNSYYDKTKCNLGVDGGEETASVIGAPAKTTAEMQTKSTYIDWNFEDVWDIVKNSTPYLRMEKGIVIEESSSSGSVVSSSSSESASSSSQQEIASSSSTSRNDELSSSSVVSSSSWSGATGSSSSNSLEGKSSSSKEIASSSSTPRNDELNSSTSRNDEVSSNSRSDKLSSSSAAKSSSSSKKKSSSSTKTDAILASVVPQFSVMANGRSLQISAARIGATYALFDMQGKVLLQGRVQSANFEIPVACSGNYLIRVGNNVQRIAVK